MRRCFNKDALRIAISNGEDCGERWRANRRRRMALNLGWFWCSARIASGFQNGFQNEFQTSSLETSSQAFAKTNKPLYFVYLRALFPVISGFQQFKTVKL